MNSDISLREIQLSILEIFEEIINVCKHNNIEYFIVYGTALGAVRHKGFIPWDDDLDIGMTRENYEKFLKVASKSLPDNLFLQTYSTEQNTPFYFSKVRKDGTKFVESYCRNLDMHHGIYVDIFPYDKIPDNVRDRRKHRIETFFWSNLFIAKTVKESSVPQRSLFGKFMVAIRTLIHYVLKPVSKNFLYRKLDETVQKYNKSEYQERAFVLDYRGSIPIQDLGNLKEIYFENIKVSAPPNIEKHLRDCYGNYLEIPSIEDRVGHRPYKVEL